eukprot:jgi/Bigna1/90056/estExt_fgenesh1_pg.C_610053
MGLPPVLTVLFIWGCLHPSSQAQTIDFPVVRILFNWRWSRRGIRSGNDTMNDLTYRTDTGELFWTDIQEIRSVSVEDAMLNSVAGGSSPMNGTAADGMGSSATFVDVQGLDWEDLEFNRLLICDEGATSIRRVHVITQEAPRAIAVDYMSRKYYIGDNDNSTFTSFIREVDPINNKVSTVIISEFGVGQTPFTYITAIGYRQESNYLYVLVSMTVEYILDRNPTNGAQVIQRLKLSTSKITTLDSGGVSGVNGNVFPRIGGISVTLVPGSNKELLYLTAPENHTLLSIDPSKTGNAAEILIGRDGIPGNVNGDANAALLLFPTALHFEPGLETMYVGEIFGTAPQLINIRVVTETPTLSPVTRSPTITRNPSTSPTSSPSISPTIKVPSKSPTSFPTDFPTRFPTRSPTRFPTPIDLPPSARISAQSVVLPVTGTIRLVVDARVSSPDSELRKTDVLTYVWRVFSEANVVDPDVPVDNEVPQVTGDVPTDLEPGVINDAPVAKSEEGIELSENLTEFLTPTASIIVPAKAVGVGAFNFVVTVTDESTKLATTTSIRIDVFATPEITAFEVFPLEGIAFNTTFSAVVQSNANNNFGLQYQFLQNDMIIGSFSPSNDLGFVLPAGNQTIRVVVRDGIGGESSASTSVLVTSDENVEVIIIPVDPESGPDFTLQCQTTADVNSNLRSIMGTVNVFSENELVSLPTEGLIDLGLLRLNQRGAYEEELRTTRLGLDIIERIPQISDLLSNCGPDFLGAINGEGSRDSTDSFISFSQRLWNVFSDAFKRSINDAPPVNVASTNVIVQTLCTSVCAVHSSTPKLALHDVGLLVNSTARNPTPTDVEDYTMILDNTLGITSPIDIVDTELGADVGVVISNIINVGIQASPNFEDCAGVDMAIELLDQFLGQAASALVPQEAAFTVNNEIVSASAQNLLANVNGLEASTTNVAVRAGLQDTGGPTVVLSISSIIPSLQNCRPPPPGFTFTTNVTSVTTNTSILSPTNMNEFNITFQSMTQPSRDGCEREEVFSCQFWDVETRQFSTEGCETEFDSLGNPRCICSHLTQFAILESQIICKEETSEASSYVLLGAASSYFLLLIMLIYSGFNEVKSDGNAFNIIKYGFMCLQCVMSIPLCLILSNRVPDMHAYELDKSLLLFLIALPHTMVWGSYIVSVYQWGVINHNARVNNLANNMFTNHRWVIFAAMGVVVTVVWISFAIFIFYPDRPYSIAGPLGLAVISLTFSASIIYVGQKTVKLMAKLQHLRDDIRLYSVRAYIYTISLLLFVQSVALVAAVGLGSEDNQSILIALLVFYCADIVMLFLQIDFLRGLRWTRSILSIRSTIRKTLTNTSSNTNSGRTNSNNLRRLKSAGSTEITSRENTSGPNSRAYTNDANSQNKVSSRFRTMQSKSDSRALRFSQKPIRMIEITELSEICASETKEQEAQLSPTYSNHIQSIPTHSNPFSEVSVSASNYLQATSTPLEKTLSFDGSSNKSACSSSNKMPRHRQFSPSTSFTTSVAGVVNALNEKDSNSPLDQGFVRGSLTMRSGARYDVVRIVD